MLQVRALARAASGAHVTLLRQTSFLDVVASLEISALYIAEMSIFSNVPAIAAIVGHS